VKKAYANWTAVVLDDHKMFASTFAMLLEKTELFNSVRHFDREDDLRDFFIQEPRKDVVLFLDYFIPGTNTLFLITDMRRFCQKIRVVIVSSLTNASLVKRISLNRVEAIISKTDGTEHVLPCLKALASNKPYMSPRIQGLLSEDLLGRQHLDFTARELEILNLFSKSYSAEQISIQLNLSKYTVITHRRNLLSKSNFHSMTELIAYALRTGLIAND
jgi:DNA-binding NarL/FixJ family response regulator